MVRKVIKCESNGRLVYTCQSCYQSEKESFLLGLTYKYLVLTIFHSIWFNQIDHSQHGLILNVCISVYHKYKKKHLHILVSKLLPLWQVESEKVRILKKQFFSKNQYWTGKWKWEFWENNFSAKNQYWTGKWFERRVKMKTLCNMIQTTIPPHRSLSSVVSQVS